MPKMPLRKSFCHFLLISLCSICLVMPFWAQSKSESEPNNSLEEADEIRLGETVEGYYQNELDSDWYKLIVSQSGKNLIRINLTGVPGVDADIYIYDEAGEELKNVREGEEGEPETITHIGVTQGIYYIRAYGYEINETYKYKLSTAIIGPWTPAQEFEFNDEYEKANELTLGESVEGLFQTSQDNDWFRLIIKGTEKNNIRVDLSAVPNVDTALEICDEQGERLMYSDSTDEGQPESIINFGSTKGVYHLKVIGRESNPTDKYTLKAQLVGPWKEGNEFEVNDALEQANPLRLNEEVKGYAQPQDDEDWYQITIPEPALNIMYVEYSGVPHVSSSLGLYDEEGEKITVVDMGEEGEEEKMARMKVPAGKYYLAVHHLSGFNAEDSYSIKVERWAKSAPSSEEIQKSLTKALDYLTNEQTEEGFWTGKYEENAGIAGLCLMAFLGAECVPKDYSLQIKKTIQFIEGKYHPSSKYKLNTKDAVYYGGLIYDGYPMYEHGIATLALIEALVETNDYSLEQIIVDALNLITRSQNTENKPELLGGPIKPDSSDYGGWRYDPDSTESDLSVAGWQVLALKAAQMAALAIPEWSLPKAARFIKACYNEEEQAFVYEAGGSETGCVRAGIGALCLQLAGYPDDPFVHSALRYMQDSPPIWIYEYPGAGYPFYYWYYGTRAMLNAGGDDWQIWKSWMCRLLVDNQNDDGSWEGVQRERDMKIYTTALGALMLELCCGHVPVYMREKIMRPGFVEVRFEKGAEIETAKNVQIILDASNSMWGQIEGVAKITIAKDVLEQIITGLSDEMNVGLRLYGHRYSLNNRKACQDTELVVPIGPVAKKQLINTIKAVSPKGKTPLVYSVLEAGKDFEGIENGSIILITDGIESCNGDINSIGPALKELGVELRLHIVGFDIKEAAARAELESIAKSTEGTYLDAKDSQELLSSLEQALQIEYEILDEKGDVVSKGFVGGEPVRITEGPYKLRLLVEPEPLEITVTVKPGQKSSFVLQREKDKWIISER